MLKVAISALPFKQYGGKTYLDSILSYLSKTDRRVEFTLLVRQDQDIDQFKKFPNIKLHQCTFPFLGDGMMRSLWEQIALPKILKKLSIDVFYTASNSGLLFSSTPCVIAVRNMEPLAPELPRVPLKFRIRNRLLRWITLHSADRAARVIAVSQFVKETLIEAGITPEKIDIIYHGIDDVIPTQTEEPCMQEPLASYIVAVSKFIRYANLETLFCAFSKMRQMGYKGSLYFGGGSFDQIYENEIRTLVHKLGIEQYVSFLGYISRYNVQKLIRGCDVFLFTSTLEACPFTLLEAMHQGAAIVATNAKPMPEFCGNAAICVESHDSNAFAARAFEIVLSPSIRSSLKKKALERSHDFNWSGSVEQLLTSLQKAASLKKAPYENCH